VTPGLTPSQTVGPYLSIGLPWPHGAFVVPVGTPDAVWVRGTVYDGAGAPVPDALVETWQLRGDDPVRDIPGGGFSGLGRCPTDAAGRYAIHTVRPVAIDGQAPHLAVSVFARGLLDRVVTRIYFPEDTTEHAADPVLRTVPADRQAALLAQAGADGYRFDIRLQGHDETVFFDV